MNRTYLAGAVADDLADLFSALSDPNRVRLISALLESELSVGSLADRLGMTESAVSHQLRGLRHMRLIRGRRDGRQVFYSLADDHVEQLFRMGLEHVRQG
jgi:ArsR family transcriptional regulator, lead/cadmium/zinc/bismuth-responsive transcriptional repressor